VAEKLTRAQAIAVAQSARKIPDGVESNRAWLQLNPAASAEFRSQNPAERGATYTLGAEIERGGYLLIYDILDALGVRIISTIIDPPMVIVCRHKTYEGNNQAEILLEILRDRLQNYNYLTPRGIADESGIAD
jgi:hypothetical protein